MRWLISARLDEVPLPRRAPLLFNELLGLKTPHRPRFRDVCVFPSHRRGGSVSRHPARGAGHQGDGRVLREAAAAAEGHQPRVEQPHGLHVAGQARCKIEPSNNSQLRSKSTRLGCRPDTFKLLFKLFKCRYRNTQRTISEWNSGITNIVVPFAGKKFNDLFAV